MFHFCNATVRSTLYLHRAISLVLTKITSSTLPSAAVRKNNVLLKTGGCRRLSVKVCRTDIIFI